MFWKIVVVASVLTSQAHAGIQGIVGEADLAGRTTKDWERRMAEVAIAAEDRVTVKRATANATAGTTSTTTMAGTGVVLNADGTINMTAWDNTATAACNDALVKLPTSSNPSGTCICYNLPALDNVTGTFEADLRLFQLSTPSGDFEGIAPENIQVGLSYTGASVSPVSVASASKLVVGRADVSANGSLKLLQQYLFVGQIKKEMMTENMNMAQLEALVMPVLTLTGTDSNGKTVSTNVSSNEAAFVAGVFSNTVVMSNTTIALAAVNELVNGLHNGTVAFVLPGVQIIIFPIGLVITSVWLVVALAVIGFGMVERISYREQYKRRAIMSSKPMANRI